MGFEGRTVPVIQVRNVVLSGMSHKMGGHEGIKHAGTEGAITTTFVPKMLRGVSVIDPGGGTRGVGSFQRIPRTGFGVG